MAPEIQRSRIQVIGSQISPDQDPQRSLRTLDPLNHYYEDADDYIPTCLENVNDFKAIQNDFRLNFN
jgi:hypothetical protein